MNRWQAGFCDEVSKAAREGVRQGGKRAAPALAVGAVQITMISG